MNKEKPVFGASHVENQNDFEQEAHLEAVENRKHLDQDAKTLKEYIHNNPEEDLSFDDATAEMARSACEGNVCDEEAVEHAIYFTGTEDNMVESAKGIVEHIPDENLSAAYKHIHQGEPGEQGVDEYKEEVFQKNMEEALSKSGHEFVVDNSSHTEGFIEYDNETIQNENHDEQTAEQLVERKPMSSEDAPGLLDKYMNEGLAKEDIEMVLNKAIENGFTTHQADLALRYVYNSESSTEDDFDFDFDEIDNPKSSSEEMVERLDDISDKNMKDPTIDTLLSCTIKKDIFSGVLDTAKTMDEADTPDESVRVVLENMASRSRVRNISQLIDRVADTGLIKEIEDDELGEALSVLPEDFDTYVDQAADLLAKIHTRRLDEGGVNKAFRILTDPDLKPNNRNKFVEKFDNLVDAGILDLVNNEAFANNKPENNLRNMTPVRLCLESENMEDTATLIKRLSLLVKDKESPTWSKAALGAHLAMTNIGGVENSGYHGEELYENFDYHAGDRLMLESIPTALPILQRHERIKEDDETLISAETVLSSDELSDLYLKPGVKSGLIGKKISFNDLNYETQHTVFSRKVFEEIALSHDAEAKKQATERNMSNVQQHFNFNSGDLVHGSPAISDIVSNGLLCGEALGERSMADKYPLGVDFYQVNNANTEDAILAVRQSYGDNFSFCFSLSRTLHPERYSVNDTGAGGDIKHMTIFGAVTSTELSAIFVKESETDSTEDFNKKAMLAKESLAQQGLYIPVYDINNNLIFSPEEYNEMRSHSNE